MQLLSIFKTGAITAGMLTAFMPAIAQQVDGPFAMKSISPDPAIIEAHSIPMKAGKSDEPLRSPQMRLGENNPLIPPFVETFDNFRTGMEYEDFERYFKVIDVNNDSRTWRFHNYNLENYGKRAYLLYPINEAQDDDWLITRAIRLKAGKYYRISLDAALYMDDVQPHIFEVKVGNYDDPDGLNTEVIAPIKVYNSKFQNVEGWFSPEFDGLFYIGIHGITPKYENFLNYLYVDNIACDAPVEGTVPGNVTDIEMRNDPDNIEKNIVYISFNAPANALNGSKLQEITGLKVMRGETLIKEYGSLVPGTRLSLTDEAETEGDYEYRFIATNSSGEGVITRFNHYAGLSYPVEPIITEFAEFENSKVRIKWTAPTRDINGCEINSDLITYNVYQYAADSNQPELVASGLKATEYEFTPLIPDNNAQVMMLGIVTALLGDKESGESNTEYLSVGKPYELPYLNSFTLEDYYRYVMSSEQNDDNVVWRLLDDNSDPDSQDGDDAYICLIGTQSGQSNEMQTGKIDLTTANFPVLSFYTFVYTGDENFIELNVIDAATGKRTALATTYLDKFTRGGWQRVSYSLKDFVGKVVRIGLRGAIETHGYMPFDNFRIEDVPEVDLTVTNIYSPAQSTPGKQFTMSAVVENRGSKLANNYTVSLIRNGSTIYSRKGVILMPLSTATITLTDCFSPVAASINNYKVRVTIDGDANPADNLSEPFQIACITPSHPVITDLIGSENNGSVQLSWSAPDIANAAPEEHTEGFEAYEPFATELDGWTMIDMDEGLVGGFKDYVMPVSKTKQAFWVVKSENDLQFIPPHEGENAIMGMFALSAAGKPVDNDDWLISPELFGGEQTIGFWARSLAEDYGLETMEVYYSKTGTARSDFWRIKPETEVPAEWTNYYVTLPAGAKYFAIRYTSLDKYIFLLDDFTFIPAGTPRQIELKGYNIYRNGELQNSEPVTGTSYVTARDQSYDEYAVTAVYDKGESASSNIVSLGEVSIDGVTSNAVAVPVEYFNLQGIRIDSPVKGEIYIVRMSDGSTGKVCLQ